jgi:hypothetical protein
MAYLLVSKQICPEVSSEHFLYYNSKMKEYADEIHALTYQILYIQTHFSYLSSSIALLENQWKEGNEYHRSKWISFQGTTLANRGMCSMETITFKNILPLIWNPMKNYKNNVVHLSISF